MQLGIPGIGGPVHLRGGSVGDLGLIASGVVAVGDGKARGVADLGDAAGRVVGGGDGVGRAVDGDLDLVRAAQGIIGVSAGVAAVGRGRGELADTLGCGVPDPGGGERGVDSLGDAAQQVVGEGGGLFCRVGLGDELVGDVVAIGGGPQVRVVGRHLAPAHVVDVGGDVTGGVGRLRQVAEGIVLVAGGVVVGLLDLGHLALGVLGGGGGLVGGVGGRGGEAVILLFGDAAVGLGGGDDPVEVLVGEGGKLGRAA